MALMQAVRQGQVKNIKEIINKGDILTLNSSDTGTSLLIEACKFEDQEIAKKMVKLLLKHGANVNHRDKLGRNALHWASLKGNKQMVNLLTGSQATVDIKMADSKGNSILFYAVQTGNCGFVRHVCKLYKLKCVKDVGKNKDGVSAADLALKLGHRQCAIMCREVTKKENRNLGPILEGDSNAAKAAFFSDLNERVILPPISSMPEGKAYKPGEVVPRIRKGRTGNNASFGDNNFHPQARPESVQSDEIIGMIDYKCVLSDLNWIQAVEFTSSYRPGVDEVERMGRIKDAVQNVASNGGVSRNNFGNGRYVLGRAKRTRPEKQGRANVQRKAKKVGRIRQGERK